MSKGTVLVTGVTGFLGTAVAVAFLEGGYRVRGTARSSQKAEAWIARFPKHKSAFEHAVVEDIAKIGAFDDAVQGVDYVVHVASPFHYNFKDNRDMLDPAINGTKSIIKAISGAKGIKHLVLTSSFAAILDLSKGMAVGTTYTDEIWNPVTYDEALKSDNQGFVYCASKKLAEEVAWDAVKSKELPCPLTSLCPPLILGAPQQEVKSWNSLNTSASDIWKLMNGSSLDKVPDTPFPVFTDVTDVAALHVKALEVPAARNERYMIISGHFSFDQAADIIRKDYPDLAKADRIAPGKGKPAPEHYKTDSSKAERDFGFKFIPLERSIGNTVNGLLKIEKEIGGP